jgi:antirestriction protein ArdC
LRRDKRLIFVAAGAAQKAADFVLGDANAEVAA